MRLGYSIGYSAAQAFRRNAGSAGVAPAADMTSDALACAFGRHTAPRSLVELRGLEPLTPTLPV